MNLKNKKIAILGFGLEGKSSLNFLIKSGVNLENITILDGDEDLEIIEKTNKILGEKYLDNLGDFDLIFKSPGISPYNEKIINFREKLISNAEIFFEKYNGKIIGITATKGKSTTSTLLYKTLEKAGYKVKLVGNIGNPIFDEIDIFSGESYDFIVYELSSYMLETLKPKLFIGILGNIYPCHIDWHNESMNVYAKAKTNLLENSENIIINENFTEYLGENLKEKNINTFGKTGNYSFDKDGFYINSQKFIENKNILLAGEHNKFNISSVIGALDIIGDKSLFDSLKNILENFSGLAHRQEKIGEYKGITFIDDGISTTPESTIEAIKTFGENIGTIFLGGADYGFTDESFANLREYIEKYKIPNIVLFIETGSRVFGDISKKMEVGEEIVLDLEDNYSPKILKTDSMEEAIKFAYKNTGIGKSCLLSSASPSFSLWKSYIHKAEEFTKFIKKYSK